MSMRLTEKHLPAASTPTPGPRMLALREKAEANLIWRFYIDSNHRWRWQHLSVQGEVISESPKGHKEYEECLADAKGKGYVLHPSHARLVQGGRSR